MNINTCRSTFCLNFFSESSVKIWLSKSLLKFVCNELGKIKYLIGHFRAVGYGVRDIIITPVYTNAKQASIVYPCSIVRQQKPTPDATLFLLNADWAPSFVLFTSGLLTPAGFLFRMSLPTGRRHLISRNDAYNLHQIHHKLKLFKADYLSEIISLQGVVVCDVNNDHKRGRNKKMIPCTLVLSGSNSL